MLEPSASSRKFKIRLVVRYRARGKASHIQEVSDVTSENRAGEGRESGCVFNYMPSGYVKVNVCLQT